METIFFIVVEILMIEDDGNWHCMIGGYLRPPRALRLPPPPPLLPPKLPLLLLPPPRTLPPKPPVPLRDGVEDEPDELLPEREEDELEGSGLRIVDDDIRFPKGAFWPERTERVLLLLLTRELTVGRLA